jgi:hypothetical protein
VPLETTISVLSSQASCNSVDAANVLSLSAVKSGTVPLMGRTRVRPVTSGIIDGPDSLQMLPNTLMRCRETDDVGN